jgi:hypothetical protein
VTAELHPSRFHAAFIEARVADTADFKAELRRGRY